jgi:hypothetical protein
MKILILLTSHAQLGNTGRWTEPWLEELLLRTGRPHICNVGDTLAKEQRCESK